MINAQTKTQNLYKVRIMIWSALIPNFALLTSGFANIRPIKSQYLKCLSYRLTIIFAQWLKWGVQSRMNMLFEYRRQAMLQPQLSDQQLCCVLTCDLYWICVYLLNKKVTSPWTNTIVLWCENNVNDHSLKKVRLFYKSQEEIKRHLLPEMQRP